VKDRWRAGGKSSLVEEAVREGGLSMVREEVLGEDGISMICVAWSDGEERKLPKASSNITKPPHSALVTNASMPNLATEPSDPISALLLLVKAVPVNQHLHLLTSHLTTLEAHITPSSSPKHKVTVLDILYRLLTSSQCVQFFYESSTCFASVLRVAGEAKSARLVRDALYVVGRILIKYTHELLDCSDFPRAILNGFQGSDNAKDMSMSIMASVLGGDGGDSSSFLASHSELVRAVVACFTESGLSERLVDGCEILTAITATPNGKTNLLLTYPSLLESIHSDQYSVLARQQ
jgi:hypothetical protein